MKIMTYTDWSLTVIQPFLQQFVTFIANLVLAIVVFIIGYLISVGIGRVIAEILKSIKFNKLFEKEGWKKALQRANVDLNPAEFIGAIFKWVFVIVALLIAVDILKLTAFAGFLTRVLNYLPNVIVAVLVFVVAIVISDIVEKIVRVSVERLKIGYGYLAASIVKWAIWIFAIFLILGQLLPNNALVVTLYTGIVYGIVGALALGIGLAIGLGGKDTAGKIIADTYKKIEER
ncbi:MAG: hypothetical protein A2998_03365 [Candidatus Staskawiczbacteria bacterium RIFCSPLOWO2_01_FULL_37_25b]|uniref:Small-conductance mechanosensitive ion channel n=1 Tax=Candidatus Staskawiczbacteria bacterium RIFCSPLOWO2_01_FULL_37_25b TaxID=1802213 RepID=A0A1G2IBR2_9BACT|nr:MAG: hypothetical protein A2998_03365 [Candidatus Staskawiczbacteria bacterium RIFCSPLOWO2_01_FULL_37_25b]